jgi:hypothetical protein
MNRSAPRAIICIHPMMCGTARQKPDIRSSGESYSIGGGPKWSSFTNAMKGEGASAQTLEYLGIALTQMTGRVAGLAKRCIAENKESDA